MGGAKLEDLVRRLRSHEVEAVDGKPEEKHVLHDGLARLERRDALEVARLAREGPLPDLSRRVHRLLVLSEVELDVVVAVGLLHAEPSSHPAPVLGEVERAHRVLVGLECRPQRLVTVLGNVMAKPLVECLPLALEPEDRQVPRLKKEACSLDGVGWDVDASGEAEVDTPHLVAAHLVEGRRKRIDVLYLKPSLPSVGQRLVPAAWGPVERGAVLGDVGVFRVHPAAHRQPLDRPRRQRQVKPHASLSGPPVVHDVCGNRHPGS